jgi:hypothetical protein
MLKNNFTFEEKVDSLTFTKKKLKKVCGASSLRLAVYISPIGMSGNQLARYRTYVQVVPPGFIRSTLMFHTLVQ